MRRSLNLVNLRELDRFENLNLKIFEVMEQVLNDCLVPTDQMIKNLIEIELGYINTNHPDFVNGMDQLKE
jgi:dynamin 1-like protein